MKIFLPILSYGGLVHTEYMISMFGLANKLNKHNIDGLFYPITFESLVSRGRNACAAAFLKSKYDYLLFVDTDISFNSDDVFKLLNMKKDVAIGGYPKKYIQSRKLLAYTKKKELKEDWVDYVTDFSTEIPAEQWNSHQDVIKVKYGATGFMLISRNAFQTIIDNNPGIKYQNDIDGYMEGGDNFYNFFPAEVNPETKKYESEDYGFCRLWRECGGEIFCNTTISLTHIGKFKFSGTMNKQMKTYSLVS